MATLEDRVIQFLSAWPGAEKIDDIISFGDFPNKRRADFLLDNRSIIVELKTLKTDTSQKVEKELDRHRNRDDFPLIYGAVELQKILKHLPDQEDINRLIYRNITRSIEDAIRSAEVQVRDTKEILNLPNAIGLTILLNEDVEILSPDVAGRKVSELLCRKRSDGSIGSSISFVWCLFESNMAECKNHSSAFPCILIEGPNVESSTDFDPLFSDLLDGWARYNNANVIHSTVRRIDDLSYRNARLEEPKTTSKLKRHEYWEQRYSANPYLRSLQDDDLLAHGAKVFARLTPYFLKGGPRLPFPQLEPLFVAWSDFLQESRYRGLDLKGFHTRT